MPVLLLIRHGRTAANSGGVLAGRTAGVGLDEVGRSQVTALGERLSTIPLARIVASPLQRTVETAKALYVDGAADRPRLRRDGRLAEVKYGEWEGRRLAQLAKEPLWRTVQQQPSAVEFPGGETLRAVQARAVEAVRAHDAEVAEENGEDAVWAAVSHGDVIKAVLADALGSHLDHFQRLAVDPASVSVIRYTKDRPFVVRVNESGTPVPDLVAAPKRRRRRGDAAVGGGSGSGGRG